MPKRLISNIFGQDKSGEHKDLVPKSLFNFALKSASMVIGFGITLLLTNLLGKEGFGHYRYAFTLTALLTMLAMGGLDRLSMREFARYQSKGRWDQVRAAFRWKDKMILVQAAIALGIGYLITLLPFELFENEVTVYSIRYGFLIVPFTAFLAHRRSSLNGLREPIASQYAERLVQPGLLVIGILIVAFLTSLQIDPIVAIWICVGSYLAATVVGQLIYQRKVPAGPIAKLDPAEKKRWLKSAVPLLLFNLMMYAFSNTDILMLRPMTNASEVGIYAVPLRLSVYVGFLMVSFNAVLAPHLSTYHEEGNREGIQKILTKTSRILTAFGVVVAVFLIVSRNWILPFFGEGFETAGNALIILVLGQLVNVICGPVGNILIMTNREWIASLLFITGTLINVALNAWLIPLYGFEGAAIATSVGIGFVNISMLMVILFKLKLNPTIFHFKK